MSTRTVEPATLERGPVEPNTVPPATTTSVRTGGAPGRRMGALLTTGLAALPVAGLAALLARLPGVLTPARPIPGFVNTGILNLSDDTPAYVSAIRQGLHGHLLYLDQFTTVPVGHIFMYPFYTLSGLALRALAPDPSAVFVALHLGAAVALLAALWLLVRTVGVRPRSIAYALCLFNAGLLGVVAAAGLSPIPFLNGSYGVMQALTLPPPHVAAGIAVEIGVMVLALRAASARTDVALGLLLVLLGLVYPFGLPGVLLAVLAHRSIEDARRHRWRLARLAACLAPAGLIPLYYWWLLHRAPWWSTSGLLTAGGWPQPWLLACLYLPTLLLALPTAYKAWTRPAQPAQRLLVLWVVAALLAAVAGGAQPERMLAGLTIPLSILAVVTLRARMRLLLPVAALLGSGGVLVPVLFLAVVRAHPTQVFLPDSVARIGAYLAPRTGERDVILADYTAGNALVGLTPARVVAGHGSQTLDLRSALPAVTAYPLSGRAQRIAIEHHYAVTYVVVDAGRYPRLAHALEGDPRYRALLAAGPERLFAVSRGRAVARS